MKRRIDYKLLGSRIQEWRIQLQMTQEELAYEAGLSIPFISEIENGKKKPSLETMVAIADAMGITLDEIMVGNLMTASNEYQTDIDILLDDCNKAERRLIYEVIKSVKSSLRQNKISIFNS